jgi:L-lactate dehydrogenase (cytochrome)
VHPGGQQIILKYAGRDATAAYDPIHPPDALDRNLPIDKHLGSLDNNAVSALNNEKVAKQKTKDEIRVENAHRVKPPLSHILNLKEMEVSK